MKLDGNESIEHHFHSSTYNGRQHTSVSVAGHSESQAHSPVKNNHICPVKSPEDDSDPSHQANTVSCSEFRMAMQ